MVVVGAGRQGDKLGVALTNGRWLFVSDRRQ
jgi:hypothetical protein